MQKAQISPTSGAKRRDNHHSAASATCAGTSGAYFNAPHSELNGTWTRELAESTSQAFGLAHDFLTLENQSRSAADLQTLSLIHVVRFCLWRWALRRRSGATWTSGSGARELMTPDLVFLALPPLPMGVVVASDFVTSYRRLPQDGGENWVSWAREDRRDIPEKKSSHISTGATPGFVVYTIFDSKPEWPRSSTLQPHLGYTILHAVPVAHRAVAVGGRQKAF
ncbi:hypothetical protein B0H17DRAFT_1149133 [Mycena rosella]|uniref:Uncharacterized protein n=1 Tax=Mycena rosella TaxID=1033263 RepID=A0AAD7C6D8_MYCRO|nr:hypothetical protein B0H17DRAFT_1149133 [Mycena rosella]